MANISLFLNQNYFGTSTSGVSSLFGSLGSSQNSTSSLTSLLSDYNNIRSGAYGKLLKTYYGGNDKLNSTESTSVTKKNTTTQDSNTQLATTRDAAKELKESTAKLTATGKDSIFNKKDVKQKDGTTKEDYDTDAIYSAVSDFVKDYNTMIEAAGKSNLTSISNKGNGMASLTGVMSKSLAKVGITVGVDNKLSVDEKTFKAADMSRVKSLFNGSSSYAAQISSYASSVVNTSSSKIAQLNGSLYNSSGVYGSNYAYSGSLYTTSF